MFAKTMTAALLGSTLLASAAFAQSPSTSTTPAASASSAASDSTSYNGNWRASKVVGLNVYNDGNESLGSINDILLNKDGQIQAVVIGVGGFLGVGERYVAIPYSKVKFVDEPVKTAAASGGTGGSAMPGASPSGSSTSSTTTTGAATGTSPTAAPAAAKNPWYPDHAVISATKDELKGMSEFKYTTN